MLSSVPLSVTLQCIFTPFLPPLPMGTLTTHKRMSRRLLYPQHNDLMIEKIFSRVDPVFGLTLVVGGQAAIISHETVIAVREFSRHTEHQILLGGVSGKWPANGAN